MSQNTTLLPVLWQRVVTELLELKLRAITPDSGVPSASPMLWTVRRLMRLYTNMESVLA